MRTWLEDGGKHIRTVYREEGQMAAIGGLFGLASLVLYIMVLIKLFSKEGVLMGILAIICGLYAFIWGWINHRSEGLTNIMLAWTACIILGMVLGGVGGASSMLHSFRP